MSGNWEQKLGDTGRWGDAMKMLPEVGKKACRGMDARLAEMLLDASAVPEKVRTHVTDCTGCGQTLEELRATLTLLDQWEAPEPNPYFMTRMEARLREERATVPAAWPVRLWMGLRDRMMLASGAGVRPLTAMAMSLVLLIGGGTYMGITDMDQEKAPSPQAAVVQELQTMDSNAQLLDQLEAMDTNDDDDSVTN